MTLVATIAAPAQVAPGLFAVDGSASDDTGAPAKYALLDYKGPADTGWRTDLAGRRIDGPGAYEWLVDASGWANGVWTLRETVFSTTAGVQAAKQATVTVKAAPPPPVAAFTVENGDGAAMVLTSVSTGDALVDSWEVDGAPYGSDPSIEVRKAVGLHTVKLTVTDAEGRSSFVERSGVAWAWTPKDWMGQSDTANGPENPGGGEKLPEITELLRPDAAFRTLECINDSARDGTPERYSIRPQPDGSAIFRVCQSPDPVNIPYWDHPGTTGGDRAGAGWNRADANGNTNVMGGTPLEVRFIRHGVEMRPETWLNPDGSPVNMRGVHNNVGELHGKASGGSTVKWAFDVDNVSTYVEFQPNPGPVPAGYKALAANKIAVRPVAPGAMHVTVVELLPGTLEQGGYVRVWRYQPDDPAADAYGFVCVSTGIPSYRRTDDGLWYVQDVPPDPAGRIFGPVVKFVQQPDGSFAPEALNFGGIQLYRQKTQQQGGPSPLPPSSVRFELPRIGPTYESVVAV